MNELLSHLPHLPRETFAIGLLAVLIPGLWLAIRNMRADEPPKTDEEWMDRNC